jgi:hypothetical protein
MVMLSPLPDCDLTFPNELKQPDIRKSNTNNMVAKEICFLVSMLRLHSMVYYAESNTTPKKGGLEVTLKGSFSEYFSPLRRKER